MYIKMSQINHCFHSTNIAKYGRVKQYQMFVLRQYFFPYSVYYIDTKSIPLRPLHFIRCISCHIIERVLWRCRNEWQKVSAFRAVRFD